MSDYFNYIAFGNWDYLEGKVNFIEMDRGRIFEYTSLDIAKRLEDLGANAVEFLEKLPVFLCSEIARSGDGVSMLVKFGRIEDTIVDRKAVSANFIALVDFGEVYFSKIEEAKAAFSADGFQLYRTHWAVREGDAIAVLNRLAAVKPEVDISAATRDTSNQDDVAKPPPEPKKTIGSIGSIEEFLQVLYSLPPKGLDEVFYRGHEDARFQLTPSLLRKSPDGSWLFMPNEERLCKELLIAHYDEFQDDRYCFDRLVRMQHYGLPTRLLDISSNPLVALFFACHGLSISPDDEGEVVIFHVRSDKIKYYDSDTVSCIANLCNLTYEQKNELDLKTGPAAFNKTNVAGKLLHHIKSEKGYFEARIIPDDIGSIICVKAKRTNTRIKSQSGAFLIFGHEATLPENGRDGIIIRRITIRNKTQILRQLDSFNINATTVYPSIDQTAKHLRAQYLVGRTS